MPRILAIDYGKKRCGIAVTDELQIIATGLDTIETPKLLQFLAQYFIENQVEEIVLGQPMRMHGEVGELEVDILKFIDQFKTAHPQVPVKRHNEIFTSKMASRTIFEAGVKKKKRQEKGLIDKVSAAILLQSYMEAKGF